MLLAPHRDQRLDTVLHAGLDIGLAAVTIKPGLDSTRPWGNCQLLEHGLELVLVNAGRVSPLPTMSRLSVSTASCALWAWSKPPPATGMMRESASVS
jgi:hypothetical protein